MSAWDDWFEKSSLLDPILKGRIPKSEDLTEPVDDGVKREISGFRPNEQNGYKKGENLTKERLCNLSFYHDEYPNPWSENEKPKQHTSCEGCRHHTTGVGLSCTLPFITGIQCFLRAKDTRRFWAAPDKPEEHTSCEGCAYHTPLSSIIILPGKPRCFLKTMQSKLTPEPKGTGWCKQCYYQYEMGGVSSCSYKCKQFLKCKRPKNGSKPHHLWTPPLTSVKPEEHTSCLGCSHHALYCPYGEDCWEVIGENHKHWTPKKDEKNQT